MGLYNKGFSILSKGIGNANAFAMNHVFPTLKSDFNYARGFIGGGIANTGVTMSMGTKMSMGGIGRTFWSGAKQGGNIMRGPTQMSFSGMGINKTRARIAGYGTIGAVGMWGLSGD